MYDKLSYKSLKNIFLNNFYTSEIFEDFILEVEKENLSLCKNYMIDKLKKIAINNKIYYN